MSYYFFLLHSDEELILLDTIMSWRGLIWTKGQSCMAKWSGDGEWHQAKVVAFEQKDGQKLAWVSYDGYEDEDDEIVPLESLKPIATKADSTKAVEQCNGKCKFI
jgi:hypothetical protein